VKPEMAQLDSTDASEKMGDIRSDRIAVVIPCYKVRKHILDVIGAIGPECSAIYVVDDCCPESSGDWVTERCTDPRVRVLRHEQNQGVGGAVLTGYLQAQQEGMDVAVKIDGDGQMDPSFLWDFVDPILSGDADYTKGNRFYSLSNISRMPALRIFGNAALSFMSKLSTGYWNLFDPTNGYTAIHCDMLRRLDSNSISRRYFFETDMLFRLNTIGAVVVDVPMDAKYEDEVSNLRISNILMEFLGKHLRNFFKRIFYNYFLRDMSVASLELLAGALLLGFGLCFSGYHWLYSLGRGMATPVGTIVIGMISILSGLQLILAFITHDVENVPRRAIHRKRKPRT
jgi:glycosyltransferase involved in cell wall biosynthesis